MVYIPQEKAICSNFVQLINLPHVRLLIAHSFSNHETSVDANNAHSGNCHEDQSYTKKQYAFGQYYASEGNRFLSTITSEQSSMPGSSKEGVLRQSLKFGILAANVTEPCRNLGSSIMLRKGFYTIKNNLDLKGYAFVHEVALRF